MRPEPEADSCSSAPPLVRYTEESGLSRGVKGTQLEEITLSFAWGILDLQPAVL